MPEHEPPGHVVEQVEEAVADDAAHCADDRVPRTSSGRCSRNVGVIMVMVVVMRMAVPVVRMTVRVPMIAVTCMRISNGHAGGALRHAEQIGRDAGDNRG